MSARSFMKQPCREGAVTTYRYRLVCGSCGVGAMLGHYGFGQRKANDLIPQKFEDKGWSVGRREEDDRCPACVNRAAEARRKKIRVVEKEAEMSAPTSKPVEAPQRADPPREMTREHRRIIFAKLEDIYVDESSGYSAGWTDERVATDLGVPRAWVTTIRDENFGPDNSAELIAAMGEAKTCVAEAAELRKAMEALTAKGADWLKRADAIERTVKRIETAMR